MDFGVYKEIGLNDLIPYDRNARTHSDAQVLQLANSIKEYGFTNPLLVDPDNNLIAGHGRLLAAKSLGMETIPCIVLSGLSDIQRRGLILADNKLAMNAGWDVAMLTSELSALRMEGVDLDSLGFSLEDIGSLFDHEEDKNKDVAPPVPTEPVAKLGDVWICGPHRVMCGSSTSLDDMHKLMGTERADCVWTDPPYNVAYESVSDRAGNKADRAILNDNMSDANFKSFLFDFFAATYDVVKPGGAIYVSHSETERANFSSAFLAAGFKLSGVIIWYKDSMVMGRSDYQWQHEPILYGWKKGSSHRWFGGRKNTTVQTIGEHSPFLQLEDGRWQVSVNGQNFIVDGQAQIEEVIPSIMREKKPQSNNLHPTMKPVALIEKQIKHSARPKDIILDPFGGSGSTMIAAERLGMCARLMELDPGYVDVIVSRWELYTGRKAELGQTTL